MTCKPETVESYAQEALDYWQSRVPSPHHESAYHDYRFCPCLVCADGREVMGYRSLIPELARPNLPDETP